MRGQVAPRAPDGFSDTPGPFGKIIIILNGPGVSVSLIALRWRGGLAALTHGYTLGFLVIAAISILGALSAAFLNIGTPLASD
jgi:hypothetical protein